MLPGDQGLSCGLSWAPCMEQGLAETQAMELLGDTRDQNPEIILGI